MLFSPKRQMIASYQSNNIGEDLATQHRPFMLANNEIDDIGNAKTELLPITSLSPGFIKNKERYLLNSANLLSLNYLNKLNDDKELKTNISYYNDFIKEKAQLSTEYYLDNDTFK